MKKIFQKGFAAFYLTILILIILLAIGLSLTFLTLGEEKMVRNLIQSRQAYYTAEAGIEDALLKLRKNLNWSSPYTLKVNESSATIEISDLVGGSRTITSQGNTKERLRKIQIVYQIETDEIAFYYGAQIGDGGMEMGNNSRVLGNVFSNGSVIAPQRGYIENSIQVAGNSEIEGLIIGENAWTYSCEDSTIAQSLTYVSGGTVENCSAATLQEESEPQEPKDLPIPQTLIDEWKSEAENGGVISGDYVLDNGETEYLGPQKISGNLTLDNNSTLIMTGTLWVVGDVSIRNGATLRLDAFYESLSGVVVVDGQIQIRPGVTLEGSGQSGSYLLLLSTNSSLDPLSPAIDVHNNTSGSIFYTNQGLIVIRNNVEVREVTGYQIYLEENALVQYEVGLENTLFSSGPGGAWQVVSWQEVE
jgi:Tfp pilus assembly protein PilX